MDWKKWLLSGVKFFGVALVGVIVAALTVMQTGYQPQGPVETVLWQYIVLPVVIGAIGLLQNYLKHRSD